MQAPQARRRSEVQGVDLAPQYASSGEVRADNLHRSRRRTRWRDKYFSLDARRPPAAPSAVPRTRTGARARPPSSSTATRATGAFRTSFAGARFLDHYAGGSMLRAWGLPRARPPQPLRGRLVPPALVSPAHVPSTSARRIHASCMGSATRTSPRLAVDLSALCTTVGCASRFDRYAADGALIRTCPGCARPLPQRLRLDPGVAPC